MKRCHILILIFITLSSIDSHNTSASDEPFISPNNWGITGLMDIPTARFLKENHARIGLSQIYPYRYYYGTIGIFDGVEISGRLTEVLDSVITTPGWEEYGNYKDKAVGMKLRILNESKYLPSFALGIMDPHGTRLYAGQYLVLSKQIYPFDLTIGMGNGRFGKRPLPSSEERFKLEILEDFNGWLDDSNIFWGIQFSPTENFSFILERSPIEYHVQTTDPAKRFHFQEPVPSHYNLGFKVNLWNWAEIVASYQRGDTFGINLSVPFEIGKPMIPIFDPPYREPAGFRSLSPYFRIMQALSFSGFYNIGCDLREKTLTIDLENGKYFYDTKALEVILKTIYPMIPSQVEDINIIFKDSDLPLFSFHFKREDLLNYVKKQYTREEFYSVSELKTSYSHIPLNRKQFSPKIVFGYKPQWELFLNDPSGFWKGKVGLSLWGQSRVWKGGSIVAGIGIYPFSNISTINEPLSIPVRTDIVDYIDNKVFLERMFLRHLWRIPDSNIFTRLGAGILEIQYAGLDAEVGSAFLDGLILLGLNSSITKKRDPDNPFGLREDAKDLYWTSFLKSRINLPLRRLSLDIKLGRFLAGDEGIRFEISKDIKGVKLSAWYSFTDTSVFEDPYNRDYHDKGIAVSIPIRLFKGTDSRAAYEHRISPWTRDVAQDISHFTDLFDMIERGSKFFLDNTFYMK